MNKKRVCIVIFIYCFIMKYMLHVIFPFLLAILCFFSLKPFIDFLERCFHIKKSAIGVSLLLIIYFIIIIITIFLFIYGFAWLFHFLERAPFYYEDIFIPFSNRITQYIEIEIPFLMNKEMVSIFDHFLENSLISVMSLLSSLITKIPHFMFSFFIFMISTFFLFIDYDDMKTKLLSVCSKKYMYAFVDIKNQTMRSIGIYLRCQLVLMLISFFILFVGFLVLRIPHSLFYAFVTSLLDSLPFIGVGIALIPMCILYVLQKSYLNALYIFLIYLIINVIRSFLEPHIMNKQMKIPSFILLVSMTIHLYFFGLIGIVLSPIHMNIFYCILDYSHQS